MLNTNLPRQSLGTFTNIYAALFIVVFGHLWRLLNHNVSYLRVACLCRQTFYTSSCPFQHITTIYSQTTLTLVSSRQMREMRNTMYLWSVPWCNFGLCNALLWNNWPHFVISSPFFNKVAPHCSTCPTLQ